VPSAEIDILQLAWVSAALLSFLRAYVATEQGQRRASRAWAVAALLCVTGGFLTKWTAPAFFYLTVIPFLVWRRQWRWLLGRDHLLAAGLAVAMCLSWAVLVSAEVGWSALRDTVGQEAAQRFAPKASGKPCPWVESLVFPAVVLAAGLPWAVPVLFALRPRFLRALDERERTLVQFLHCWLWPNLLFWSLPAQHHVRYVLPVAPAITLLGVIVLSRWMNAPTARRFTPPRAGLIAAVLAWAVVKVLFVQAVVPERTAGRNARDTGEQLASLVPDGEILYLCRLKDEGVLFYYGRPARRLSQIEVWSGPPIYVLMLDAEWDGRGYWGGAEHLAELRDQQQAPIHLVRLHGLFEGDSWPRLPPTLPTFSPSAP
jgi:4-amino-4-deoxy-L-arabinose transferase-like glycosyltransferase